MVSLDMGSPDQSGVYFLGHNIIHSMIQWCVMTLIFHIGP